MKIRRLTPLLGAEAEGLDLTQPVSGADLDTIKQAFTDHGVLIVRGQARRSSTSRRTSGRFSARATEADLPRTSMRGNASSRR